jgi:anaerobic magnesium-protoporphyrin IX monomethyl ester cyclase
MRVTLINPPRFLDFEPSLGLLYVASALEKGGHEVAIVDKPINKPVQRTWETLNATFKKAIDEIIRTEPDLIGVTSTIHTFYALDLLEILKDILPESKIAVGGPHVSFIADDVLSNFRSVDFVVRGEGEHTAQKLATALESDGDTSDISGLSYRNNGRVVNNPDAPLIENLDELPYPARHLVNLEEYPEQSRISLISSRGCPHQCIFCSSHKMWKRYRPRSIESVLGELTYVVEKYSPKRVNFVDDTFAVNRTRTLALCREMRQKGLDVPWTAMTRVGIERELLQEMYNTGCRLLYFGCESGNDSTLRAITKGVTTSQIESAVKMALQIGFIVICSFVINLPFENSEGARTTIGFAKKLKGLGAQIQAHSLAPYPGTEVYDNSEKYHLTLKHRGIELWKIMSHPLYLAEQVEYPPQISNNLISEQELTKLWSEIASVFDYY